MSARRVRTAVLGVVGGALVGPALAALAYWTIAGGADAATRADRLEAGNRPTAVATAHRVLLHWPASGLTERSVPAGRYDVRRYRDDGSVKVVDCQLLPVSGAATVTEEPVVSCVDGDVDAGTYRYTVTPRINEWTGDESAPSDPVVIARPTVSVPEGTYVNGGSRPGLKLDY